MLEGELENLTDLFLFHQFRIWAIVYHIFAKDGRCEGAVYFLRIEILVFTIQYKLVALDAQADSRFFSEQNECKDIAILDPASALVFKVTQALYLLSTAKEELVGINAICNRAANEGYPVKDHWGLIWVFDQQLAQDV